MKSVFSVLFAALTLTCAVAFAAMTFKDSGTSSIKIEPAVGGEGESTTIVETRYLQLSYPSQNLLKAVITTQYFSNAEGLQGKSSLEVRTNGTGRLDKILWTAQEPGSEVKVINEEFIGVVEYGCCAAPDITRLLSVNTGRKVEAAAGDIYQIEVPNSSLPKRYVSLALDSKAPGSQNGKTYVGTVSYYSNLKILARARVYADLPHGWGTDFYDSKIVGVAANSKIEVQNGTHVTLWDADGVNAATTAFGGFAFESTLAYENQSEKVRIVISQDTIDTQASSGTKGLYLEFVK